MFSRVIVGPFKLLPEDHNPAKMRWDPWTLTTIGKDGTRGRVSGVQPLRLLSFCFQKKIKKYEVSLEEDLSARLLLAVASAPTLHEVHCLSRMSDFERAIIGVRSVCGKRFIPVKAPTM